MFKLNDLYEWLMEEPLESEGDRMVWEGLATKFYIEFGEIDPNKLFDVVQKAKNYGLELPNEEMAKGWKFISQFIDGKIVTPEELEKLGDEYAKFASGTDSTSI